MRASAAVTDVARNARISVLGPTTVTAAGKAVEMRSVRQRRLIAALVLANGRMTSTDALADAVWGDHLPVRPGAALQNQVSRLRSALGAAAAAVETVPGGYRIAFDATTVDAVEFERRVHEARSLEAVARAECLSAAVAMWRGGAYDDLDTDDSRTEATRLTEVRLAAEEDAAAALVEVGRLDVALPALEAICAREPLRERPRLDLARSFAASGRQAEALRELDNFRRVLAAELGITPSAAAVSLYDAILADDLPPALNAARSAPRVLSQVFGRADDLAGVMDRLAAARIVTLVGPGGVGKTTLALLAAAAAGTDYEHGCHYIDLSAATEPVDVATAFARGVGVDVPDPAVLTERLVDALGHRRTLLVIDNAEQVVSQVAETVARLTAHTDAVDVLVTSREPLNISGERLWPVEPLAANDQDDAAIQLFCDRAAAIQPGWAPDPVELISVVEICRRLDGLPLAVELAAAHVRFRSCDEILSGLDLPLDLLDRSTSTVTRRRGLRGMADWSYDLLEPLEAQVFDRLSVFSDGFVRESARRLCADLAGGKQIDTVIDTLVDRSLVRIRARPHGTRLSLLEPLRQYGLAHLAEREQDVPTRSRHAEALLDLAERANATIAGPDEAHWVAALDEELADLVAAGKWLIDNNIARALRLAQALYFYAFPRGRLDVLDYPEQVLAGVAATDGELDQSLLAAVYGVAADRALVGGDFAHSRELLDLGFAAAARASTAGSDRYCHGSAGDLALFTGATADASTHLRASAAGFLLAGHSALAAWVTAVDALPYAYSGLQPTAIEIATEAVRAADETRCPSARAFARYALAEASLPNNQATSRRHLVDAIRLADSVGAAYVAGLAHLSLATLEARTGNATDALPHYAALLEMWRRSGNWTQQWTTMRTLVVVLADLDRLEAALRLLIGIDANADAPRWGADDERLASVEQRARRTLDPSRLDRAVHDGSRASSAEVLAFAQAAVEDLLTSC